MISAPILTRRGYAILALGVAAFIVYGSLVPFRFESRPDAVERFGDVLRAPVRVESRSDTLANVLLGVPLGFALLGALRVDRAGRTATLLTALAVWPLCVALAAAVEFGQLFVPGRTSSGSDIAAQGFGAIVGLAAWILAGPRLTESARRAVGDARVGGRVGRLLAWYAVAVVIVQLLPMDLSLSPYSAYRKVRDGGVTWRPFSELMRTDGTSVADPWGKVQTWIELAGLFLPVGLLASRLRLGAGMVFALAALLAFGTEASQILVSRHPSVTDALIATAGVMAGWLAARSVPAMTLEAGLVLGQLWFAALAVAGWQPFDFGVPRPGDVNWLPFADLNSRDYLGALDTLLIRVVLYVPFGVIVAAVGKSKWPLGAVVGLAAAVLLEAGQMFLPSRYPSTTEWVFAMIGGALGAFVAGRIREPETTT